VFFFPLPSRLFPSPFLYINSSGPCRFFELIIVICLITWLWLVMPNKVQIIIGFTFTLNKQIGLIMRGGKSSPSSPSLYVYIIYNTSAWNKISFIGFDITNHCNVFLIPLQIYFYRLQIVGNIISGSCLKQTFNKNNFRL
jgi:hypothetical protein